MLCCELGQCWLDRQLITLFKIFPLRKGKKKKKWCNSPGLLLWLCNCIVTQSPRAIVLNNIPAPLYTEGHSGCFSLPVFSALCKEWNRESEIRRMKKVMKFSVQTQKVHSVLDVRGKSEKEASAFQTLTSLRMGWHWSGRQRTQTGCWSSAAEALSKQYQPCRLHSDLCLPFQHTTVSVNWFWKPAPRSHPQVS